MARLPVCATWEFYPLPHKGGGFAIADVRAAVEPI